MSSNGNGNGHTAVQVRPHKSDTIGKVAEALAKAQGEMEHAKKSSTNPHFRSSYADLADCIDAAQPHLSANGLAVVQQLGTDEMGNVQLITTLAHASGEWFASYYPIQPVKRDPQGYGSAITYARRYSFQAIIGQASSDDDANAASGRDTGRAPSPARPNGSNVQQQPPVDHGAVIFEVPGSRHDGKSLREMHANKPGILGDILKSPNFRGRISAELQKSMLDYIHQAENARLAGAPPLEPVDEANGPTHDMHFELES